MLTYICIIVGASFLAYLMKKMNIDNYFSKTIIILIFCSLLSNIGLAQNYTQSLIPEINDGVGISNMIARLIIGGEGWTQEQFKITFELSLLNTAVLILIYMFTIAIKRKD